MNIIEPSFEIIEFPKNPLELIEKAARICYQSELSGNPGLFVERLITRGHMTPIEHVSATVKIVCDRGVMAELTRHRLASFNIQSTRYCNFSKNKFGSEITVIRPSFWEEDGLNYCEWKEAIRVAEEFYFSLLFQGATPQEARSVLPNSLATQIIMTANFREFLHVFKLRCSKHAHPQIREIALPMLKEFWNRCPVIFNDLYDKYFGDN